MTGRGKKLNQNKNAGSARDFAAGKKLGRPKQEWVNDATSAFEVSPGIISFTKGYWRKVNVTTTT